MVLCSLVVLALTLVLAPTSAPAQVVTVTPGDTVVSQMAEGRLVAIGPDGQVRELATGLSSPRGVAVLADGSILVAETGQNRIVGIGGRFGTGAPEPIVSMPFPEGITVSPDGQVFATALQAGEMGRVDIDAGTFTPIARDLEGPGDVAVRGIAMFVTESGPDGRVVTQVAADGRKAEFADGFDQPIGLAFGPGATLFVADFAANRIIRLDAQGNSTDFAAIEAPAHLAIEPWIATEGQPFTLSVTSAEGVVRFDETGARVGVVDLTGTAGVATVPGTGPGGTPGPTVATTAVTPTTTAGTTPTSDAAPTESAPATTRPPRTTTSLSEEEGAPSSTSGGILLASIVIIAVIVVGGIVFAVVQRPKSGDKSGFEERPLDTNTVALAFGSCAAEEVELAEAEGALASLEIQSESAEKRLTTAEEQVVAARARLAEARHGAPAPSAGIATTVAVEAPAPAEPPPTAPSTGLRLEDLELTTAAGRAALDAFLKREIEADELEEMWRALGEDRAIEVVRSARPGATTEDRPGPDAGGPDESPAADAPVADVEEASELDEPDDEAVAAAQLAEAEEDVAHAHAEIERLLEREAAARGRISAARASLEACQERHRAELDAEAVANAEAATVAAASARTGPPAPSAPTSAPAASPEADPPGDQDAAEPDLDPDTATVPIDPAGDPDATPAVERATVLPTLPERPPLTPDAATVASLRRPKPGSDPGADADEASPGGDLVDTSVEDDPAASRATSVRRDGLDRGLFDPEDDADDPSGARSTFPGPAPVDPDPGDDPAGDEQATDPHPMAPEPVAADRGSEDPALADLLFRGPSNPADPVDQSAGRLDDLVFAWPSSGFQKLPAPEPEPEPETAPEPPAESAGPRDGEPPRDDLDFL